MIIKAGQSVAIPCTDPPLPVDEPLVRGSWLDPGTGIITHESDGKTMSEMVAESIAARNR